MDSNIFPTCNQAYGLGYARHIAFWADHREGFTCPQFKTLIEIEQSWLRDYYEVGPFDAVWEAEFYEELMQTAPEELHDADPGMISAAAALALVGAAVIRSSNEGALDDPPISGQPFLMFFCDRSTQASIAAAAEASGLEVIRMDERMFKLAGRSLRAFPNFAARIHGEIAARGACP